MNEHRPSHGLLLLTGGVLLSGTLLLPFGTRDVQNKAEREPFHRHSVGASLAINPTPERVQHGSLLQTMECAGCHDGERREIGPSFRDIAQLYRGRPGDLAEAIDHPQPGWGNYPSGPSSISLSKDERASLVSWILEREGDRDD
jgi:cytochrome c